MLVMKFGGSSVANPERIKNVIEIVRGRKEQYDKVVVVCSAFRGVTDLLINIGRLAETKNLKYKEQLEDLKKRHLDIANEVIITDDKQVLLAEIEEGLHDIERILEGICLLGECSDKSLARLSSYGERLSCFIISAALKSSGIPSMYVNAIQIVKTEQNYLGAKVNYTATNKRIVELVDHLNAVPVVTGFIGSNSKGEITTLGRGGSDFTASIFGAALKAKMIEIWTDVDGALTANPNIVERAVTIPELSYKEAMELSHFGAKVIYPPTILPALVKKIPLAIKNSFKPEHPGTLIIEKAKVGDNPIKGISSISEIALMRLEGSGMFGVVGTAARLFGALSRVSVNIIFLTQGSSEHSICFGVAPDDVGVAATAVEQEFRYEIQNKFIHPIVAERDKSVIAVVGENMMNVPGVAGRLFKALGKNGINVKAIAQGSSELNITTVIDRKDEAKALNALHEIFFNEDLHSVNLFLVGPTGLIGSTLLQQIYSQKDLLQKQMGMEINVMGLINSKNALIDTNGIDLTNWKKKLSASKDKASLSKFVEDVIQLNFANSVFVDCSASKEVTTFYEKLLNKSISIVTPNKIANTLSLKKYNGLREIARKRNSKFLYETNVGAGLPVINTLNNLLKSGDHIIKIEAVLSGTLSYIFNNFKGNSLFSEVVLKAKQEGYTEPDPRDDLSGLDVARKALILSRELGVDMELEDISVENLVPESLRNVSVLEFLERISEADKNYESLKRTAESEGKALRYMAVIEDGHVKIVLKSVDSSHPFYNLSGSDNMIVFTSERYKKNPLVVKGPGAGAEVTAAGVFAEIITIGNFMAN
ncbi:MAG: bifunctional aspartate kinase/homoserine dehydrogenase I [Chitinophagales bacterium]|nr:bifunctional aspartate kinase/homoserine dehydrogenase I [Chitinophagales bacterium]